MGTGQLHLLVVFVLLLEGCVMAADPSNGQEGSGTSVQNTNQDSSAGSNEQPKLGFFQRVKNWYHDKICSGLYALPTGLAKLILMLPNLQSSLVRNNPPTSCAKLVLSVEYRVTKRMSQLYSSLIEKRLPVIWVVGGPGSGKGTMCKKMVQNWNFLSVSIGESIRELVNNDPNSVNSKLMKQLMMEGELLPDSTTLVILEKELLDKGKKGKKGFLIDGFPRNLEGALMFQKYIKDPDLIVYLKAKDETLMQRALQRKDGRADDNKETMEKRLQVFHENVEQILSHESFTELVVEVDGEGTEEDTYKIFSKTVVDELKKRD